MLYVHYKKFWTSLIEFTFVLILRVCLKTNFKAESQRRRGFLTFTYFSLCLCDTVLISLVNHFLNSNQNFKLTNIKHSSVYKNENESGK